MLIIGSSHLISQTGWNRCHFSLSLPFTCRTCRRTTKPVLPNQGSLTSALCGWIGVIHLSLSLSSVQHVAPGPRGAPTPPPSRHKPPLVAREACGSGGPLHPLRIISNDYSFCTFSSRSGLVGSSPNNTKRSLEAKKRNSIARQPKWPRRHTC